ncbi:SDR family oxidoreductase [Mesoplasma lactucae]|uniref:Short-chain dehydrogenase/reductase n=1 Tax=Mesoplasma lactucae ATCC 49193 TaxID=81460 RepID=A0A291IR50_9MOLU|nr:SDR family oxidoreductase [Mesoplasma lactucae]ATG97230.1 short-chain dehydrogenase/reductase [Mesoplasma lactucae ATCC 49193]ATZ20327.1 short-chain dehydrogenase/reductase [Mesoplasma lactucae ATCC 49193]MCL8216498.1 3-phenylpropionate-dihydrodiol/cinnamic acid-dihydrodiol dehydrogenase [Mesoplasma lactucae ATCC 49193]
MEQKVWFITGAGSGFGAILVQKLLASNNKVIASSRKLENFKEINNPNFLGVEITKLADAKQVKDAVEKGMDKFGRIDVLMNNAGYGQAGAFEEVSPERIKDEFDVNLFGMMNVTRRILPIMRKQKQGRIINVSSTWGFTTEAGWSTYNASKFAVDGWTLALGEEVKQFGIDVTSLMPGAFKTGFLKQSLIQQDEHIPDYDKFDEWLKAYVNDPANRGIDPDDAMDVVIKLANMSNPPKNLLLGQGAIDMAKAKDKYWEEVIKTSEQINFGK